ncbi:MAG TPA: GNAT family N-acetyltransferase [Acidimicrobiia bacterium]|nr:GNAT family N-acetyltransferase [Acidimicrobiia bacterium]
MTDPDVAVLDNPIWHALDGPQRHFAQAHGAARRFRPGLAPFAGIADAADPASWADLAALVGPGGVAVLVLPAIAVPAPWASVWTGQGLQMVLSGPPRTVPADGAPVVELTTVDVDEILGLVERTQPGPFLARTIELGRYVGIRDRGRLVAMAGERMRGPGFTEVSAVCTDEAARGRGLARRLVAHLAEAIHDRGEQAILHVVATNTSAVRAYEAVGFNTRDTFQFGTLTAAG